MDKSNFFYTLKKCKQCIINALPDWDVKLRINDNDSVELAVAVGLGVMQVSKVQYAY